MRGLLKHKLDKLIALNVITISLMFQNLYTIVIYASITCVKNVMNQKRLRLTFCLKTPSSSRVLNIQEISSIGLTDITKMETEPKLKEYSYSVKQSRNKLKLKITMRIVSYATLFYSESKFLINLNTFTR